MTPSKSSQRPSRTAVPIEQIPRAIFELRGHRVILDSDLAAIYGVRTSHLNQAVKRNRGRFPDDFLMQVSADEVALMSQIVTSKKGRGGRRKPALAFTEHGAAQAANVINSPRAIAMSIFVVRAFMRLREYLASTKAMARRLDELETRIADKLATHDDAIAALLSAMRELMNPPARNRRSIGFTADIDEP